MTRCEASWRRRRRWPPIFAGLLAAALFMGTTACSSTTHQGSGAAYHGDVLAPPVVLDSQSAADSFSSSDGGTTTLANLQRGHLMLVYFGYTHCPDICPTTMADLAAAVRRSPLAVQQDTQVVFITSDPARDTPPVINAWLRNFDSGVARPFIGLTGPIAQIDKVASSVGVPLEPPVKQPNGSITVQHGAQTLAFIDGKAGVLWTAGAPVADYAQDILRLAAKLKSS